MTSIFFWHTKCIQICSRYISTTTQPCPTAATQLRCPRIWTSALMMLKAVILATQTMQHSNWSLNLWFCCVTKTQLFPPFFITAWQWFSPPTSIVQQSIILTPHPLWCDIGRYPKYPTLVSLFLGSYQAMSLFYAFRVLGVGLDPRTALPSARRQSTCYPQHSVGGRRHCHCTVCPLEKAIKIIPLTWLMVLVYFFYFYNKNNTRMRQTFDLPQDDGSHRSH